MFPNKEGEVLSPFPKHLILEGVHSGIITAQECFHSPCVCPPALRWEPTYSPASAYFDQTPPCTRMNWLIRWPPSCSSWTASPPWNPQWYLSELCITHSLSLGSLVWSSWLKVSDALMWWEFIPAPSRVTGNVANRGDTCWGCEDSFAVLKEEEKKNIFSA